MLHLDETLDLHASYSGKYGVNTQSIPSDSSSITLIRCPDLDEGIKYEVMAGFRLTRQYPQIPIYVITNVAERLEVPAQSKVIQGDVVRVDQGVEVCGYR